MKTNCATLLLAVLGLAVSTSLHAGFYPDSVKKICTAVPPIEGGMPTTAQEYRPFIKCANARADYLDSILKRTLESAIATVEDVDTQEMLRKDYSQRYAKAKKETKSDKSAKKDLAELSEEAQERLANNTTDLMKVLSILYPSKYPKSRFRMYLEEQDLEKAYKEALSKTSNKATLAADQKKWLGYREEFCSGEVFFWLSPTSTTWDEECKNIVNRIRTRELSSMATKR